MTINGAAQTPRESGMDVDCHQVFQHLTAEKSGFYRAIMRQFAQAKSQFVLHMNVAQVAAAIEASGSSWDGGPMEVERALHQLCDWGNLEKHLDTGDVASVHEFLRPRFLYQISLAGQAAERALEHLFESLM